MVSNKKRCTNKRLNFTAFPPGPTKPAFVPNTRQKSDGVVSEYVKV